MLVPEHQGDKAEAGEREQHQRCVLASIRGGRPDDLGGAAGRQREHCRRLQVEDVHHPLTKAIVECRNQAEQAAHARRAEKSFGKGADGW